jgi:protein-S-isoprenylcysteine O-methyltransferase Ste14
MKKRIGIQGSSIAITLLLAVVFRKAIFPAWAVVFPDMVFDVVGLLFIMAGFFMRMCARGYKEEHSAQSKSLVTDGPYAIVRNPMYFGTLLIGTGVISVLFQWWMLLLFFGVFFLFYAPVVRKEEAFLMTAFKEEYARYVRLTPRYFPRPSMLLRIRVFLSLRPFWIRKELQSFVLTLLVVFIIEAWQDARLFGWRVCLGEGALLLAVAASAFFFCRLFLKPDLGGAGRISQ